MISFLRSNPGLMISALLLAAGALVCGLFVLIMGRSGASFRPIIWFACLFSLVVVPQFAIQLGRALWGEKTDAPRAAALEALQSTPRLNTETGSTENASPARPRDEAAKDLFGPDVDPALIIDARALFADALAKAGSAQFATFPSGESVLVAKFQGPAEAEKAWVDYLRVTGLSTLPGKGDSERGFAVSRPAGDRLYAVPLNSVLWIGSGPDDAAIRRRMAAGGFAIPRRAPLDGGDAAPGAPASSEGTTSVAPRSGWSPLAIIGAGIAFVAYLLFYVAVFFKGASWASSNPAAPNVTPTSLAALKSKLEAINQQDVPYQVESSPGSNEWTVTWRYADAKWIDFARAHGMRATHRLTLRFDEASHRVRATESAASYDWSAGARGGRVEWRYAVGITLFQFDHRKVLGLQLDGLGTNAPKFSAGYTFNLQNLKAPIIETVTQAGWDWRPVAWNGPTWLRWLIE